LTGLANSKTVTVQPSAGDDKAVVLSTTKTKKQNAPAKLQHKNVMRKEFRKMAQAVKNQVLKHDKSFQLKYPCYA
jgi:large subunit ribosomal protein L28e